jgi:hypothetical protein
MWRREGADVHQCHTYKFACSIVSEVVLQVLMLIAQKACNTSTLHRAAWSRR